jgi:enoyl-CoA hydratase/carnithine racemase
MCAWKIEEVEGTDVLIITINSNKSNCINYEFLKDLHNCFDILDSKYPHRPIILTSASETIFSSGMDLKIVGAARTKEESKKIFIEFEKGLGRVLVSQRRTIGMVNGSALAGGFFLALACDYRIGISKSNARFGANEVVLGIPFPTSLEILKFRITAKNAWNCVLSGKIYTPEEV